MDIILDHMFYNFFVVIDNIVVFYVVKFMCGTTLCFFRLEKALEAYANEL